MRSRAEGNRTLRGVARVVPVVLLALAAAPAVSTAEEPRRRIGPDVVPTPAPVVPSLVQRIGTEPDPETVRGLALALIGACTPADLEGALVGVAVHGRTTAHRAAALELLHHFLPHGGVAPPRTREAALQALRSGERELWLPALALVPRTDRGPASLPDAAAELAAHLRWLAGDTEAEVRAHAAAALVGWSASRADRAYAVDVLAGLETRAQREAVIVALHLVREDLDDETRATVCAAVAGTDVAPDWVRAMLDPTPVRRRC